MKALLLAASALTLVVSAPAFAAGDDTNVTTNVAQVCKITNSPSDVAITTTVSDNGNNIGQITGATFDLVGNKAHLFCNVGGSQVSIARTKLTNAYTPSAASQALGFTNTLDYTAQLTGNTEFGLRTFNTQGFLTSSHGNYGVYESDMTLSVAGVQLLNLGKKPVAGAYTGVVTITLSAS